MLQNDLQNIVFSKKKGFKKFLRFLGRKLVRPKTTVAKLPSRLQELAKRWGGRIRTGRIVCRGRGGRVWRHSTCIDIHRRMGGEEGIVVRIVNQPSRTAYTAFSFYKMLGVFTYILGWQGVRSEKIFVNSQSTVDYKEGIGKGLLKKNIGNAFLIGQLPVGTHVFSVEAYPGSGALFTRAAGTTSRILQKVLVKTYQLFVVIRLPSGTIRYSHGRCAGVVGQASNHQFNKQKLKKAGVSRQLGFRPKVRGVAMNPVDHPHGGGEGKTSGGRVSVTPWGKLTKGKKTLSKSYRRRRTSWLFRMQSSHPIIKVASN